MDKTLECSTLWRVIWQHNRMQLVDRHHRKAYAGGQMYSIQRDDLLDMMRRYDVALIER